MMMTLPALLVLASLLGCDARWGQGGGKGVAARKHNERDQVLLEEIRSKHSDLTEADMMEHLVELRAHHDGLAANKREEHFRVRRRARPRVRARPHP